jgi:hypothetical protein
VPPKLQNCTFAVVFIPSIGLSIGSESFDH